MIYKKQLMVFPSRLGMQPILHAWLILVCVFSVFSQFFAAVISFLFPVIAGEYKSGSGYAFTFFSVMMIIQALVVWKYFPETKGKTPEQLGDELSHARPSLL